MNIMLIHNTIFVLAFLTVLSNCAPPFSWVAPRMFGSYQVTIVGAGGAEMNCNFTGNPPGNLTTLALQQPRSNISTPYVVLAGMKVVPPNYETSFKITVAANISTQLLFKLSIFGTSQFYQISFFVILLGPQSATYIQTHSVDENCNMTSETAAEVVSTPAVWNTSISNFKYVLLLSYYSVLKYNNSGSVVNVGTIDGGAVDKMIKYSYLVRDATLSHISFVIFVHSISSFPFTQYSRYGLTNPSTYSDSLWSAFTTQKSGYLTGFNDKCLLGMTLIEQYASFQLSYDMNNIPVDNYLDNNITCKGKNCNSSFYVFCLIQLYNCSLIDAKCRTCISYSMCETCEPGYYAQAYSSNLTSACLRCSDAMLGCFNCTNSTVCVDCIPNLYIEVDSTCSPCANFMPNCQNCTNQSICTFCLANYIIDSGSCILCSSKIPGCKTCIRLSGSSPYINCTLCLGGYFLNGTICTLCNVPIPNCAICSNNHNCQLCNSDSYQSPDNSTCICNDGLVFVSGFCSVSGCSSAYRFSTATVCLSCNTTNNFYYSGSNCACVVGYQQMGINCQVICGDGLVLTEQCDDGNVISGDGCSSSCTIETNYDCVNGTIHYPSVCVYIGPLTLSLLNIVKTTSSNEATILLTISPATLALNRMLFNNFMTVSIGGQNITYKTSYDQAGTVSVVVWYSSNLEGLPVNLTLSYDQTKVALPSTSLSFNMVGSNLPVVVSEATSLQSMVYNIGYGVAAVFVLTLLLSLIFHKMIGLETMQVLQLVFFARFLLPNYSPAALFNINSIKYINLYNYFTNYTNVRTLDGDLIRMGLSKHFAFNVAIQALIIILFWIAWLYYSAKVKKLKRMNLQSTSLGMEFFKKTVTIESKMYNGGFIFTVYSFYLVAFSLLSSVQKADELEYQLPRIVFVFTLLVIMYSLMFMTAEIFMNWKAKYDEEEGLLHRYVAIFLVYNLTLIFLNIGLEGVPYGTVVMSAVQVGYTVLIVVYRPYLVKAQNVLLVITLVVGNLFSVLLALLPFIIISNQMLDYVLIGYEVLLVGVSVIAVLRMLLHFKGNERAFKLMRQEEDRLNGKDGFSKTEFKKQQDKLLANKQTKPTLTQKKYQREREQIQELLRIKNRLSAEYRQKKIEKEE